MALRNSTRLAHSSQLIAHRKSILCIFIFSCFLFPVSCSLCYAAEALPKEPIIVNGDKVEYFNEKKEVVGTGNISIIYKDLVLTCDNITVHLDTREAIAEGNVKVTQKGIYFTGEKINYNFDTRKGTVIKGHVTAKPLYGKMQELDKLANKDEYHLERGYVTTCDLENPHYRVQSREVKIYLDDKVVAKHILLFIGNVPVLYLPYYVQPLKGMGKSNFILIPGRKSDWGYYLLTSYRYYFNENNRGDLLLDYRAKKGLAEGINHYYNTDEVGKGAFKFYYTHENDDLAYEKTSNVQNRYRFQYRHKWDMKDVDTTAVVELNKLSDRNIIKDYFYNEYEELGDNPQSFLSLTTAKKDFSTEFLVNKRFNNFVTQVERMPEFDIDIVKYRIKDTPVYYTGLASGVYLNKTFDEKEALPPQKDLNVIRFDLYNQLSYAARFFRALNVTPFAGIRDTYYSRNDLGDTNDVRNIFNAGVENSIKFYKIYNLKSNFLGLDINDLRHIVTPTVRYLYTYKPNVLPEDLNQFDDIDTLAAQNVVQLALENKLQTKRLVGGEMKSVDLADLLISTDYIFRRQDTSLQLKTDQLDNVNFQLELIPYSWAYILAKASVNAKQTDLETASLDLVLNGGEKWSFAISQRYENVGEQDQTNLLTLDATYKLNEKWKIRAYERFNTSKQAFEEQEYTLCRDLHCWLMELIYDVKNSNDQTIWVSFRLKAFPQYPVGIHRTYSHPRFGSTGSY